MISLKTSNETALRSGMMVMFDDGMMSDGNGGVMLFVEDFCNGVFVCWFVVEYRMAVGFCFFVFPLFLCAR